MLTPMDKMWVSFIGIGLMILAAVIITFARTRTKGWIRLALSGVAFVLLLSGLIYGMAAIF